MELDADPVCTRRLAAAELMKVYPAVGDTVMCCAGAVWITQEGDARDTILRAGERFTFDRRGMALIGALEGMKNEWLEDTSIAVIGLPSKLVR